MCVGGIQRQDRHQLAGTTSDRTSTSLGLPSRWMNLRRGTSHVHTVETAANIKSLNSTSRPRYLHFAYSMLDISSWQFVGQRPSTSTTRSTIQPSSRATSLNRHQFQDLSTQTHIRSSACALMIQSGAASMAGGSYINIENGQDISHLEHIYVDHQHHARSKGATITIKHNDDNVMEIDSHYRPHRDDISQSASTSLTSDESTAASLPLLSTFADGTS